MDSTSTIEREARRGGGRKLLVVANSEVTDDEVLRHVEHRLEDGMGIVLVAPALVGNRFAHAMGDVDDSIASASERLDEVSEALRERHDRIDRTMVGDSDPVLAIGDAIRREPEGTISEIVVILSPPRERRWLEDSEYERVREEFQLPTTLIELDRADHPGRVVHDDAGRPPEREPRIDTASENLPDLDRRDTLGIVVAIVGTIALIILAANCIDDAAQNRDASAACIARMLLAGGFFLINVPHVIALMMFQSTGYRGAWEKFFSRLSLYGTPAAVALSALLGIWE